MEGSAEEFEKEIKKFLKVKHLVLTNTCTTGMILGIKALGLKKNTRIAMPSYTFNATASAIVWNGLKPYLVDVEKDSFVLENIPRLRKGTVRAICVLET